MDSFFDTGAPVGEAVVTEETAGTAQQKKQTNAEKVKFDMAVKNDPTFLTRLHTKSNCIECINTLGSSKIKGLIQDPTTAGLPKEERKVLTVPGFCGYRFKNVGEEPIEYHTEVYAKDENGVYVGTKVTKTAAPGEVFDLSRKYTTMLACQPEYSYTFKNGIIVSGGASKDGLSVDEMLEKPYFKFTEAVNGVVVRAHDDNVKILVEDAEGNILPEFEEVFGYLNNEVVKKGKSGNGQRKTKVSTQELAANSIRMMIEEAGGAGLI